MSDLSVQNVTKRYGDTVAVEDVSFEAKPGRILGLLGPINSELLRDIILELRRDDRTILFASHRMEQVEQLCDDICLMAQGNVVLQGPLREIKAQFGKNTLILEFDGDDTFIDELAQAGAVRVNTRSAHRAELSLADGTDARHVLDLALDRTDELYRYERVAPPLNEIFVEVVGEVEARRMQTEGVTSGTA